MIKVLSNLMLTNLQSMHFCGAAVSNENFREFFEQFGKVIDSVVMFDRETNRHRGFGFVSFEDAADAMKVLASGNGGKPVPPFGFRSGKIKIFGKNCEVKVSEPKKGCGNDGEPLTKGSTLSHPDTNSRTNGELPGYDQFQTKQHDACSIGATCSTGSHDPSSHAGPRSSMANCTVEQSGVNIQQLDHFPYYANGGMPCYYGNEAMYYYNPIQAQAQGIYHPYFYPAHDSTTGVAPMPPQYYAPPPVYAHPYPIPPATHTGTHEYMNAQYFDGQRVREKDF